MPIYDGFVASIYDADTGVPLPEYGCFINPKIRSVTCYIETKPDQRFIVILRDVSNGSPQGTAVYVDGVYVDNGLTGPGIAVERKWFGKRIDHLHVRPFVFRDNPSGPSLPVTFNSVFGCFLAFLCRDVHRSDDRFVHCFGE